jgi:NDP-sugar pyrophosphorylase family protein
MEIADAHLLTNYDRRANQGITAIQGSSRPRVLQTSGNGINGVGARTVFYSFSGLKARVGHAQLRTVIVRSVSEDGRDNMRAMILAAGYGTRLWPLTVDRTKPAIPFMGRPLVGYVAEYLSRYGCREVAVNLHHRPESVRRALGDGSEFGLEVKYSFDGPELLGTGGALKKALPLLGKQFLVLYGDSYLPIDYAAPVRAFVASGKTALMTVFRNEGRWDTSNVLFKDDAVQKYAKENVGPEMRHIDYGLGIFNSAAFSACPGGKAFDLAEVYQDLIARGELAGYEVKQRFYEIGSPAGLAELDALLRAKPLSRTQ